MKVVKKILVVLLIIIAIPFIAALFIKKDYSAKQEIIINKPKQEVFDYLRYLKNQDNFSIWAKMDPEMKKSYKGTDGTVGFTSTWDSKKIGKGEQEIKKITEGQLIGYELRFFNIQETINNAFISTDSISPVQTKVTWEFNGHMKYPMNLLIIVMNFDKMMGEDLETGLNNLKLILEK